MGEPVSVPLWLFLPIAAFALWSLLERLLIPSGRWILRRRLNRLIDNVNRRLDIEIRPFQLTKRQVLIDRLVYDPLVVAAANEHARASNVPREVAMNEVYRYAREIVPTFNAYIYFRVGYSIARAIARFLYRVRLGFADARTLAGVAPNTTVVFVMNHRSNMDYVLVAFLAAERTALSYAVGEWARIWPLQQLIKSMGAYFVRRNSNSPIYRRVLERYVHMATEAGVAQAMYPEGGLTRDGRLREPRLGLFDYMLKSFDPHGDHDILFIPVALNYDRVLEDRTLLRSLDKDLPRRSAWFAIRTALSFWLGQLGLMLRGRWYRFGYALREFRRPDLGPRLAAEQCRGKRGDLRPLDKDARFAVIERLGRDVMSEIAPAGAGVAGRGGGDRAHRGRRPARRARGQRPGPGADGTFRGKRR
jgi:glycerol-3-phosphate O-acyltransferase